MRILAIYKYYWPDTTPHARLLKSILERCATEGHDTRVLTAQPGYNDIVHPRQPGREHLGGVEVLRLPVVREVKTSRWRRLASFATFLGGAVWRACTGPRADVIVANAHPPLLMGLALRVIRRLRGIPFIYQLNDIHPESALAAGRVRRGIGYRLWRAIDTANCRTAAAVVTLNRDMFVTLQDRGLDPQRIVLINNFLPEQGGPADAAGPVATAGRGHPDDFVVLFAGNLGHYQALDRVIEAAHLLRDEPDIRFLFMGEGAARADLERGARDLLGTTVFFTGHQPLPVAARAMAEADLSLVSLAAGVYRVAYPSKTMMILAQGCPVLALLEEQSDIAGMIRENDLGFVCSQEDPAGIAATIRKARGERGRWRDRRPDIASYAKRTFDRDRALVAWLELLERVGTRDRPPN